jgi:hypothetical protein
MARNTFMVVLLLGFIVLQCSILPPVQAAGRLLEADHQIFSNGVAVTTNGGITASATGGFPVGTNAHAGAGGFANGLGGVLNIISGIGGIPSTLLGLLGSVLPTVLVVPDAVGSIIGSLPIRGILGHHY